jgi:hypothetical protein
LAANVATKQCLGGRVTKGEGFVELVLGNGQRVRVADVPEHRLIEIDTLNDNDGVVEHRFTYGRRKWAGVRQERFTPPQERQAPPREVEVRVSYVLADERCGYHDPHALLVYALQACGKPTFAAWERELTAKRASGELKALPADEEQNPY